ncbi:MAG: alpha-amylase [Candidatus Kapabacteria bacterium]|nr:alpha-amylase [Candidatus Kapabacteria bacterium]
MLQGYLSIVEKRLKELKKKKRKEFAYHIPKLWLDTDEIGSENVNPFNFYLNKIEAIRNSENQSVTNPHKPIIYNMFLRYTATFDHNADGTIGIEPLDTGFRETGTFLKGIALLPYIKSLGTTIIYLLPVTSIGIDEKKGTLGSPYAIRNPLKIEETLGEPILDIDIEVQFKAFVEAVHMAGIKLVTEFVFRTASVDSDLSLEHPDWFYWISDKINNRAKDAKNEKQYGPPIFNNHELAKIKNKIESGDLKHLPPPHQVFKDMFTETPKKVARVETKIRGLINKKVEVRIPCAFADWPPDDVQPVWSDVTYTRMYEHSNFNYIAYNTVRMYDLALAKENYEVKELWDFIANIIPYWQQNFGLDGMMIDMGHALPEKLRKRIISEARKDKADFIIWEENFVPSKQSADEGYNCVVGYLPFDAHVPSKVKDLIRRFQHNDFAVDFFATPENHNTPRAASRYDDSNFSAMIYALCMVLPVPQFIHSGFELSEQNPVNTGLGFTIEQIEKFPTETLPLFSNIEMNWLNRQNIINAIKSVNDFYAKYPEIFSQDYEFMLLESSPDIVAFLRRAKSCNSELLFVANFNPESPQSVQISSMEGNIRFESYSGQSYEVEDGRLNFNLNSFEFVFGFLEQRSKE